MSKKPCDLRVIKTRQAIRGAFLKLLKLKPYSKISIQDISETAVISRNTFYLHYMDKAALVEELFEESLNRIVSCLHKYSIPQILEDNNKQEAFCYEFVNAIYEEKEIASLIINVNEIISLQERIVSYYRTIVIRSFGDEKVWPSSYLEVDFFCRGIVNLIFYVLSTENKFSQNDAYQAVCMIYHTLFPPLITGVKNQILRQEYFLS